MEGELERKTIVPWFSMTEWKETYKNIYSNNIDTQFTGYEQLIVWKARCPDLPIGVECTMSLLQVHIKDQQFMAQISTGVIQPYQEYELRLLYSTSFMRFLNHIASIGRTHAETLYEIAKRMKIPDWLVNLRHEVAHATCVPNLVLLREAAYFALDWLHEYYWKGEVNASENYLMEETVAVKECPIKKIKEVLEVWQALKLYELAKYRSINELPDVLLRTYIKNRSHHKLARKSGLKNQKHNELARKSEIQSKKSEDDFNNENFSFKRAFKMISNDIKYYLKLAKGYEICSFLVKTIMNGNVFIPDQSVWNIISDGRNVDRLPVWLQVLWVEVLSTLQNTHNILPQLLDCLITIVTDDSESDHRCNVASLWIKELCQSIFKTNHILIAMNNSAFNYKNKVKSGKEKWNSCINNINHSFPHLENVMTLILSEPVGNIFSLKKIKLIILTPNRWVNTFLPDILLLVRPYLKFGVRLKLITLVQIYIQDFNSTQASQQAEEPIHTISELTQVGKDTEKKIVDGEFISSEADVKSAELPAHNNDQWILSEGPFDWRRCALGILPWQKEKDVLELSFSKNIEWKAQSQTLNAVPCYDLQHNFTGNIEWNSRLKKKREKNKKKNPFIKSINNAVKIIMTK